jgi:hypothetical protein|tara:strand:- start:687 stop:1115 length:429 start_codon:yes stop_codon:yes gene_type:complete
MIANHTSIGNIFALTLQQFDKLFRKGAFLENYKKEAMFSDGLDEFEESREVVQRLVDEYKACSRPDYIDWGFDGGASGGSDPRMAGGGGGSGASARMAGGGSGASSTRMAGGSGADFVSGAAAGGAAAAADADFEDPRMVRR